MAQEGGEKGAAAAAMNGVVEIGARTLPTPVLQLAKFMLEPAEVDALCTQHGLTVHQLMELLVPPAALLARPPTSKFPVGAIGLGETGRIYVGVNLEFPNLPLHHSVHAEQFLIANAVAHGERGLKRITVNAAPCGHCRQFIAELVTAESVEIVYKGNCYHLDDILVDKFCPSDLIEPGTAPLLLEQQHNPISLAAPVPPLDGAIHASETLFGDTVAAAVSAARNSYVPYSRCPAGLALVTHSGRVYGGGVIESCAYNPSLTPLQSACIAFVAAGEPDYASQVAGAVLVELPDCAVSYAATTKFALQSIVPGIHLLTYPLHQE